jgi:hypothetical protein
VVLTALALPIGFAVGHVLLAAVWYGLFTPVGLIMRLLGRDPLCRRPDREAESYWRPRSPQRDVRRYFRQF